MSDRSFLSLMTYIAVVAAVLFSARANADEVFVFGLFAGDKPTIAVAETRPVLDALETRLSKTLSQPVAIRMRVKDRNREAIEDLAAGLVDFGRYDPTVFGTKLGESITVRSLVIEMDESADTSAGVIVVHEDSDILSALDLIGRSVAFGDEFSAEGRHVPQAHLGMLGITAVDLDAFAYLGKYDQVSAAVSNGHFDAGALSANAFQRAISLGEPLRVIESFPTIGHVWVASKHLSDSAFLAIQQALLAVCDQGFPENGRVACRVPEDDRVFEIAHQAIAGSAVFSGATEDFQMGLASGPEEPQDAEGYLDPGQKRKSAAKKIVQ